MISRRVRRVFLHNGSIKKLILRLLTLECAIIMHCFGYSTFVILLNWLVQQYFSVQEAADRKGVVLRAEPPSKDEEEHMTKFSMRLGTRKGRVRAGFRQASTHQIVCRSTPASNFCISNQSPGERYS